MLCKVGVAGDAPHGWGSPPRLPCPLEQLPLVGSQPSASILEGRLRRGEQQLPVLGQILYCAGHPRQGHQRSLRAEASELLGCRSQPPRRLHGVVARHCREREHTQERKGERMGPSRVLLGWLIAALAS